MRCGCFIGFLFVNDVKMFFGLFIMGGGLLIFFFYED